MREHATEVLLGLPGFRVVDAVDHGDELHITIEIVRLDAPRPRCVTVGCPAGRLRRRARTPTRDSTRRSRPRRTRVDEPLPRHSVANQMVTRCAVDDNKSSSTLLPCQSERRQLVELLV